MFRFCITSQARSPEKAGHALESLFQNEGLSVHGDTTTLRVALPDEAQAFLFGQVSGRIGEDGKLQAITDPVALIQDLAAQGGLDTWAEKLEGRYVIVVVDGAGGCQIAPDYYGKMDVYVQNVNGGVTIASDMSLLPHSPSKDGYDQGALAHVLSVYGNRPPKRHTIYRNVRRLGVGDTASLKNGELSVVTRPFKPQPVEDYGDAHHDDYVDAFLSSLEAAGSTDGNLVYLSSGWDSTSVLAGLVHIFGADKVQAVTGRMTYSERYGVCNTFEIERATKFAKHYGVKLDLVELDYMDTGEDWGRRAQSMMRSHGYHNFTAVNHYVLSNGAREAAPDIGNVFAGEISDGAHNLGFSQYATIFHPTFEFREYSDKMASYLFGPTFLKQIHQGAHEDDAVFQIMKSRLGDAVFDKLASGNGERTKQFFTSFFLRNARMPLWSIDNVGVLTPFGAEMYTSEMSDGYLGDVSGAKTDDLYSWFMHLYNSFHWQGSTVATLCESASTFGKTAHLPFWDRRLQAFFSAMPENWGRGLDFNHTKYPLKEMLKNKLDYPMELQVGPHSYLYDVDPSFNHAAELIYRSAYAPYLKGLLKDRSYRDILDAKVFNVGYLDGLVGDYLEGREVSGGERNDLVTLCQFVLGGHY